MKKSIELDNLIGVIESQFNDILKLKETIVKLKIVLVSVLSIFAITLLVFLNK